MEFVLKLKANDDRKNVVKIEEKELGLEALDTARRELDIPCLDAELLDSRLREVSEYKLCVKISEEDARRFGNLFRNNCVAMLDVKPNYPCQFYRQSLVCKRDESTGAVISAKFEWQLDKKELIDNLLAQHIG